MSSVILLSESIKVFASSKLSFCESLSKVLADRRDSSDEEHDDKEDEESSEPDEEESFIEWDFFAYFIIFLEKIIFSFLNGVIYLSFF